MRLKHVWKRDWKTWALILILVLTLFLRLYNTSDLSGGDDSEWAELATLAIQEPRLMIYPEWPDAEIGRQEVYFSRPFAIIPFVFSILLFGYTKFAMAFPPALFSALSVLLLFSLVRRLFDDKVALLAAFFFAVSPFQLAFSRIGLLDAFLVFTCLLAYWLLFRYVDTKKIYYIYLSALMWLINLWTTDIRGAVPILALIPFIYFFVLKKRLTFSGIIKNKVLHHLMFAYIMILVIYFVYTFIPVLWDEWGWVYQLKNVLLHSVGKAQCSYLGPLTAIKEMGSLLIFTPFIALIFVPFIIGLFIGLRQFKSFRFNFWLFYLVGIVFFYLQSENAPQRQTIFLPAIATLAAVGIVVPYYQYFKKNDRLRLPLMLAASFSYLFFMLYMFARIFKQEFSAVFRVASSFSAGGLLMILVDYWWVFSLLLFVVFGIFFFLSLDKKYLLLFKKIYPLIIGVFLFINLVISLILVHSGVGIYKRTEATSIVGNYLKQNLGDERYSCVAGIHAYSFTFYTQKRCAFWLSIDTAWLEEQKELGNVRYFILNTHYVNKAVGFGNVQPDGSLGPEISNESLWLKNYQDKYDWLQEHAVDVTAETGLSGRDEFLVYRLK